MGADVAQRFYVDLSDSENLIRDEEGVDADSLEEILEQAKIVIAEMLLSGKFDYSDGGWQLVIRSENGAVVATIPFVAET